MPDRPTRIVHARPPSKAPAPRRGTKAHSATQAPAGPPQAALSSSAAIDAFLELLRAWKMPPARGWRMLTGLGYRAGSLTSGQITRVQHLLEINAGMHAVLGEAAGEWMMTDNDAALLSGAAPVDFLTRKGASGYAALARQVSNWTRV